MSMLRLFAAATIVAALGACASTSKDSSANPGAVSGGAAKAECCGSCGGEAKMGAVSGKSDCSAKTDCATSCGGEAKMGAVSGKSDCSAAKASCGSEAKMGAVSGKSDCSSPCGEKKMETKMGAVSGKSGCCPMSKSDC